MQNSGIRVGTSGWVYPHWRGAFYPERLAAARWLTHLATVLSTVEVNATFYSLTTPRACDRWRAAVPPTFLFALKGSRYITHMKQLRAVDAALANFFASGILRLGAQIGPILWQLPPGLAFDPVLAEEFFCRLPRDVRGAERIARGHDERVDGRACVDAPDGRDQPILHALEARHASWMGDAAAERLRAHGIALVWADTGGEHPVTGVQTTETLAYVRLHGPRRIYEGRYSGAELRLWAERAREWSEAGTPVFVYFDNDRDAAAPRDARRLAALADNRLDEFLLDEDEEALADAFERAPRERPSHFAFPSNRARH